MFAEVKGSSAFASLAGSVVDLAIRRSRRFFVVNSTSLDRRSPLSWYTGRAVSGHDVGGQDRDGGQEGCRRREEEGDF